MTVISNSRQFIFVHVHKCAGTSITRALEPFIGWNDVELGGSDMGEALQPHYRKRFGLHKHSGAHEIRTVVGNDVWERYTTFAFVRNPYERIVSAYTYLRKLLKGEWYKRPVRALLRRPQSEVWSWPALPCVSETRTFSEFLRHEAINYAQSTRPQFEKLSDEQGEKIIVDEVGRVESLEEDIAAIAARIGLEGLSMPHANRSQHAKQLSSYYRDDSDYELVYERYRKDFECFGYDPEPPGS